MRLRVIDIETTGEAPPAEIIEFGRVDVVRTGDAWVVERPMARLYRPLGAIPPETMAVHHITAADFTPATPVCTLERLRQATHGGEPCGRGGRALLRLRAAVPGGGAAGRRESAPIKSPARQMQRHTS